MNTQSAGLMSDRRRVLNTVVDQLVAGRAQIATAQAREAELMAEALRIGHDYVAEGTGLAQHSNQLPYRWIAAEIATALRVSDRTVQRQMDEGDRLTTKFLLTHAAFAAGRISLAHVREIIDAGDYITQPDMVAFYETLVLPFAEEESATRMRDIAPRIADQVLPRTTVEKHQKARVRRGVSVFDLPHGMSNLNLTIPSPLAHGIYDRATQIALAVRDAEKADGAGADGSAGDELSGDELPIGDDPTADCETGPARTLDNLRADVLCDLLLTSAPTAHATGEKDLATLRAHVSVTVPVLTLVEPGSDPDEVAELDGVAPIDAATARELAGTAKGWDRILTHPITGAVMTVDRYRPTKSMKRALRTRDQHCRFPGCRIAARKCDLDHTKDHAHGGETSHCNLACLCRRHHTLKHHSPWAVTQKPGGILAWTSPGGRTYTDTPITTVRFRPPDDGIPPF